MIYNECGSSCQKTCFDLYSNNTCQDSQCVEGCFCPVGTVLNTEGKCVEPQYCPCLENGTIYDYEEEFEKTYPVKKLW